MNPYALHRNLVEQSMLSYLQGRSFWYILVKMSIEKFGTVIFRFSNSIWKKEIILQFKAVLSLF